MWRQQTTTTTTTTNEMKNAVIIIGSLLCAVTGLIPIIYKTGQYGDDIIVLNASGLYIGAGLVLLGASFDSKFWYYLRVISVFLVNFGIIWLYDRYIDLSDNTHTYGYTVFMLITVTTTIILCLYFKLRRH